MAADPADIARYTKDGVVITALDNALDGAHPDARDLRDTEIEMFFVNEADGQALLDERFDILSQLNPAHEGIETDEGLGLGLTLPVVPTVPSITIKDTKRDLEALCRVRAFAYESEQDRYSVEVIEGRLIVPPAFFERVDYAASGANETYVVPLGADTVEAKLWGGAGNGGGYTSSNALGGSGGFTEVSFPVEAGDVITTQVGRVGGYTGGANSPGGWPDGGTGSYGDATGGGGGGSSRIWRNGVLMAVAGGGGSAAGFSTNAGAGGGTVGQAATVGSGGTGGTQSAGGVDGGSPGTTNKQGLSLLAVGLVGRTGGNGGTLGFSTSDDGGAGGGGYYGGGGGGGDAVAGGGGSGFINTAEGASGTTTTGNRTTPPGTGDADYPDSGEIAVGQGEYHSGNDGDGFAVVRVQGGSFRIFEVLSVEGAGSWTVPGDWNDSDNKIHLIGAGGDGQTTATFAGFGGGGGQYATIENVALTPAASISFQIGVGGGAQGTSASPGAGDTWFDSASTVAYAQAGQSAADGGAGGNAAAVGSSTVFAGGSRGSQVASAGGANGGGAAGGPLGAGGDGGDFTVNNVGNSGAGGGGANGGAKGTNSDGQDQYPGGASGSGGAGGAGGNASDGQPGTDGSGGGSGDFGFAGGAGGDGIIWDNVAGPGGGGGGGGESGVGGNGGLYGGGGGGSGGQAGAASQGAQGVIVIEYTPTT